MAVAVGRIGHEDRLSVVDHLEELRARLIVSLAALAVAFGLCMWQNHRLLDIVNRPLAHQTQKQVKAGEGPLGATYAVQQSARAVAKQLEVVVAALERPGSGVSAATRATLAPVASSCGALPVTCPRRRRATGRSRSGSASRSPPPRRRVHLCARPVAADPAV